MLAAKVITEQGNVVCEHVVNAAGCYARQVSQMVGTDVPITNMEHTYLVTEPVPGRQAIVLKDQLRCMRPSDTQLGFHLAWRKAWRCGAS